MRPDVIEIFVADRNVMSSELLAESLGRDPRFKVATIAPATRILTVPSSNRPGVAIISADLDNGPTKGMHLARSLRARTGDISIVILLEMLEREKIIASFRAGAKAVFCRTEPLSGLRNCIERVSQGCIWAGRTETEFLLEAIQSAPSCEDIRQLSTMTKREVQVAELAAEGLTNKQIAQQLGLSEHTIKNHLFRIFDKLKVANRIELLFLMVKGRNGQHRGLAHFSGGEGFSEPDVTAAAEETFLPAQLTLGLAHLEGRGVEKNDYAAYRWLRLAELNCTGALEQSRRGLEEIKSRLQSQDIEELEQQLARELQQQPNPKLQPACEQLRPELTMIAKLAS